MRITNNRIFQEILIRTRYIIRKQKQCVVSAFVFRVLQFNIVLLAGTNL
jgi:hypothetical protein